MLFFGVIALCLPSLLYSWSFSDLFDGKCDEFDKQEPYCLAQNRYNPRRVYSTWTRFDQAVRLVDFKVSELASKCEPIMFYMMSRHSIRYPREDDLKDMEEILPKLQKELAYSYDHRLDELCSADYQSIRDWTLKYKHEDASHVTPNGVQSTKEIAKYFYFRYPHLFNPKNVKFNVGMTNKTRTYETANAFVEGIQDMEPEITSKINYEVEEFLDFNLNCMKKIGVKTPKSKEIKEITESQLYLKLRQRISKRMGFRRIINDRELETMYKACAFDQAIGYASPWCSLFTRMELNALETRRDIADFYLNGPGQKLSSKMACPLIESLHKAVQTSVRNPETRSTYLYFTHAAGMSRLWSTLGLFDKIDLDKKFCPKSNYKWKTSEILPFNANFDAVLYRCSHDVDTSNPADFRLLTMVNGNPVNIANCDAPECRADKFLKEYRNMARNCDLDAICSQYESTANDYDDDQD